MASYAEPSEDGLAGPESGTEPRRPFRAAFVTGIVTPYTNRLYDLLASRHGIDLHVLACSAEEPGRLWKLPAPEFYKRTTLQGLRWHRSYVSHLYLNPGAIRRILRLRPDVLMVSDFSPTMLLSAATARLRGIPVAMTSDSELRTDPGTRSLPHRLARRAIAPLISAGIGGSDATLDLFAAYGIGKFRVVSPLAPAWRHDGEIPGPEARPYDLLYCGLVDDRWKGALHFIATLRELHARGLRPRVRVVGDGPLLGQMREQIGSLRLDAHFDGYLQQSELARAYMSAKLFLFPSRGDTWGLVANEAAQCGTPIVASPHAQAAHGLVERFGTGTVVALDTALWADEVERLLGDPAAWAAASRGGVASTRHFSMENAADSLMLGLRMAMSPPRRCDHAEPAASSRNTL